MKRKRGGLRGSGDENLPPSSSSARGISRAALQNQAIPLRDCSVSNVPLTDVFSRVYQNIGSSPSSSTFHPLNTPQSNDLASPRTPSIRLFGVDLTQNQPTSSTIERSCLTNTNFGFSPDARVTTPLIQNSKRRRKPPCSVLNDITNISHFISNGNEETQTSIDRDIEKDDQLLADDFIGGMSDLEGELDFDCSSQESSDSETEADNIEVHARPDTDPYAPPPFCMKSILERTKKRKERSTKVVTKPKEEELF
ncbi:hypothetical protein Rs2_49955 [Raphanus sativus]|nr:hypothetical protein Rs2_49955 [Raphanus sativus]